MVKKILATGASGSTVGEILRSNIEEKNLVYSKSEVINLIENCNTDMNYFLQF